eukprot:968927_1
MSPSPYPTKTPVVLTTRVPTSSPTDEPIATLSPSPYPITAPTVSPTRIPISAPTDPPTPSPSLHPISAPLVPPTTVPTSPTQTISDEPTAAPTAPTTETISDEPTAAPTTDPTETIFTISDEPTAAPTTDPTANLKTSSGNEPTSDTTNGETSILPTYNPSIPLTNPSRNERDKEVVEAYASSISPTVNIHTPSKSDDALLAILAAIAAVTTALIICVLRRSKQRKEQVVEDDIENIVTTIDEIVMDDNMETEDPMERQYTVEGPGERDGQPHGDRGELQTSDIPDKKIWNSEVQLVNMLYRTPKPEAIRHNADTDMSELERWLANEAALPQYFAILIKHGYSSMQTITHISNRRELKEIGIESKQHQMILMEEIQKWKAKHMGTIQGQTY